jgi:hypothetical protein
VNASYFIAIFLGLALFYIYFKSHSSLRELEKQLEEERAEELKLITEQIKKLDGEVTEKRKKYEEGLNDYNSQYRTPPKPDGSEGK